MAWSTRMEVPCSKDEIDLDSFFEVPEVSAEIAEQILVILEAVRQMNEAVGRPEDKVFVSVTGHTNPGHAPRAGWQDEHLHIHVTACPSTDHRQMEL